MQHNKHIVVDARGLRHSTGRYTRKILDYIQKIDSINRYTVLVNDADLPAWQPLKKSTNFHAIAVPYQHYSFSEQVSFPGYLRSLKPDLVWFTMPQQPLLYRGRRVTTIHDLILVRFKNIQKSAASFRIKQFVFKHAIKRFARRSRLILTLTQFTKNDIVNYTSVNPDKVKQIYLAADKISAKPISVPALSGKEYLFYVGNAHVHKNLPRALQAFAQLKKTHPDLQIAFAGNTTLHYERLQLLAEVMEEKESVHILGHVSDAQLRWLYEHARIYIFPTLDEGFGLPGLEAMQYDVPVVASNISCLPEVYGDSVAYFDPSDPSDMASSINSVLTDTALANKLIARGRKKLSRYSWEKAAKETHDALIEAVN